MPSTFRAVSGSASHAAAMVRTPCSICPGGAVIRVGQRRAVPRDPWARTIATTCSTVSSGLENECPHRPLSWMSQNAGPTQSSFGLLSAGPSAGRTAAMIPFRISISIQLDVLKSRATITIACSPGLGGPTARTCATRWPRSSPAGLTHGSSPSAAARRPRNRGRADGPWSAWIEIRDGTERPGTRGGCAARRSRQ